MKKTKKERKKNCGKERRKCGVMALLPYQQCNENVKTEKLERENESKISVYCIEVKYPLYIGSICIIYKPPYT